MSKVETDIETIERFITSFTERLDEGRPDDLEAAVNRLRVQFELRTLALQKISAALMDNELFNGKPLKISYQEAVISRNILIACARAALKGTLWPLSSAGPASGAK